MTQELKNNAVVAGQIETAATTVAAVFNKVRAATPTPHHVAENRQTRARWAATDGVLGLHQWLIAELDTAYEVMWLESIVAHDSYYHDTSYALGRAKQPWWSPHQQPAEAPTTAGDHPPTHNALDIPSQITQHHDTAEWCRLYALNHAIETIKHRKPYEQQSTYAKTYKSLTDHDNPAVKLYNKLAQHHREAAQLYQDLPLGRADISALARKYVDIATAYKQTMQHMDEAIKVYLDASETLEHSVPWLRLARRAGDYEDSLGILFNVHNCDLQSPDLHSYTDKLQRVSGWCIEWEMGLHEVRAEQCAAFSAVLQGYALSHAEKAGNAWRAARQHAQSMTDHAHDFFVFLQKAAR